MSDSILVGGEELISSKRASKETGYTQDYIGQLARGGSVAGKRLGGHWYISLSSLRAYKLKADEYKPQPPVFAPSMSDVETTISLDGRDFVSASHAARLTGYHQDYVGQLARSGKIASRQIGNRWFVDRDALIGHKNEKDVLYADTETKSMEVPPSARMQVEEKGELHARASAYTASSAPFFTYSEQHADLMPMLSQNVLALPTPRSRARAYEERYASLPSEHRATTLPIRRTSVPQTMPAPQRYVAQKKSRRRVLLPLAGAVLTIVVVLAFGFTSLKDRALHAFGEIGGGGESASAASAKEVILSAIERVEQLFSHELHYTARRK